MKQRWLNFEEWQLMVWFMNGCPPNKMPGKGDDQIELSDFLTKSEGEETWKYKWDLE